MGKTRIELLDFSLERMLIPHFTWIAFFITFFMWSDLSSQATAMLINPAER